LHTWNNRKFDPDQLSSETCETLLQAISSFTQALEVHRIALSLPTSAEDIDRDQKYTDLQVYFYSLSVLLQKKEVVFFSLETEKDLHVQAIEVYLDCVGFSYARVRPRDQFDSDTGYNTSYEQNLLEDVVLQVLLQVIF
jgi:hypothetical protein